jgi:hypothetical protein
MVNEFIFYLMGITDIFGGIAFFIGPDRGPICLFVATFAFTGIGHFIYVFL